MMTSNDWRNFFDYAADISYRIKSGAMVERKEQLFLDVAKECYRLGIGKDGASIGNWELEESNE